MTNCKLDINSDEFYKLVDRIASAGINVTSDGAVDAGVIGYEYALEVMNNETE